LLAVHPLGKSPVISDGDKVIAESGTIMEYIARVKGGGRFVPAGYRPNYWDYMHWMHYAEGSAMLPLLLSLYTSRLGEAAAPLAPRITSEIVNHFTYMNNALARKPYFAGDEFTVCDMQMRLSNRSLFIRWTFGPVYPSGRISGTHSCAPGLSARA